MDLMKLDEMKAERTNRIINRRLPRNATKLLRLVEAFLLFFSLSWISSHLSPALRFSGDFLSTISSLIISPASVFLIGNIIIVVLIANLGRSKSGKSYGERDVVAEICADLASAGEINGVPCIHSHEEVVYEDKRTILEVKVVGEKRCRAEETWRRRGSCSRRQLRRSETETHMVTVFGAGNNTPEKTCSYPDSLSSEEFRLTIEAFIAKQIKFQREESLNQLPRCSNH